MWPFAPPRAKAAEDPSGFPAVISYGGTRIDIAKIMGQSPARLYRDQPNLRTVVSFVLRNIAQLGLHVYTIDGDGNRQRDRTSILFELLERPNSYQTPYDLIAWLVGDLMLHDSAYWWIVKSTEGTSLTEGWTIRQIPAAWVIDTEGGDSYTVETYIVRGKNGRHIKVPAKQIIHFHGWNPTNPTEGLSPIHALKVILSEQIAAWAERAEASKNGHRVGAVITRPVGSPKWEPTQREKFMRAFKRKYIGRDAEDPGGVPILEDGMTINNLAPTAKDAQFAEAAKLAVETVASVYHINPTMIGVMDNANYSNVREFHKSLYSDTLGPILKQLTEVFNTFLLPILGMPRGTYVEFNVKEKLSGSFEEQAAVLQTSVGAPWLTVNEARAMQNLPPIEGGNELIRPLNMGTSSESVDPDGEAAKGGTVNEMAGLAGLAALARYFASKESERDESRAIYSAKLRNVVRIKAEGDPPEDDPLLVLLRKHFKRQRDSITSALNGSGEWWDGKRWDKELGDDLLEHVLTASPELAKQVLTEYGYDPADYDEARTEEFLKAFSTMRAEMINEATRVELAAAIEQEDDEEDDNPAHTTEAVFDRAEGARAVVAAVTMKTALASFSATEAAKQVAPTTATKTWITVSAKPRSAHKRMDGQTVGIEEKFSNKAEWPGDPILGAEGVANCKCTIEIKFE